MTLAVQQLNLFHAWRSAASLMRPRVRESSSALLEIWPDLSKAGSDVEQFCSTDMEKVRYEDLSWHLHQLRALARAVYYIVSDIRYRKLTDDEAVPVLRCLRDRYRYQADQIVSDLASKTDNQQQKE